MSLTNIDTATYPSQLQILLLKVNSKVSDLDRLQVFSLFSDLAKKLIKLHCPTLELRKDKKTGITLTHPRGQYPYLLLDQGYHNDLKLISNV